jgi:hypothetical protein
MLLAAFTLACIGERYTWPIVPALIGAAGLFLISGARVGADPLTRSIDVVLIAALAVIGLQLIPLPSAIVRAVSPATPRCRMPTRSNGSRAGGRFRSIPRRHE